MDPAAEAVFDVLIQGRPSVDLTFLGLPEVLRQGEEYFATGFGINPGASFIESNALRRLGLHVGLVADLGSDFFSRYILHEIRAAGVAETFLRFHDRDMMEISAGISYPHERIFITWDAARDEPMCQIMPEDLQRFTVRCVFSKGVLRPDTLVEVRRQGIPICSDTYWNPQHLRSDSVRAVIAQADIFLPNLLEAQTMTDTESPEDALAALQDRVEMVAIKLGAAGAIGSYGGVVYRVPSPPVAVVDTTGAGDNFNAGFLYGLLHGKPFEECLRCAVAAGSFSTRYPGGVQGSPTEEELLRGIEQI